MSALGLLTALVLGAGPDESTLLTASLREPLEFLHVAPTGEASRVSRSDVLRVVEQSLSLRTDLEPHTVDPSVNEDCRGQLACIVRTVTRTRISEQPVRWLLLLTQISLPGEPDRISLTLISLPKAEGAIGDLTGTEAELALSRAETRADEMLVSSPEELTEGLLAAIDGPFEASFRRHGHLAPTGQIHLLPHSGAALVHLDGQLLGATVDHLPTVIERVPYGTHELRLTAAEGQLWRQTVQISATVPLVELSPHFETRGDRSLVRPALVVGGGVVALSGLVLVILAAAQADGSVSTACFEGVDGCSGGSSFIGLDYDPTSRTARGVDPDGLGLVPVGVGLTVAGTGIALGALLEEGEGPPWVSLAVSIVAGGAVVAFGAALDQGAVP